MHPQPTPRSRRRKNSTPFPFHVEFQTPKFQEAAAKFLTVKTRPFSADFHQPPPPPGTRPTIGRQSTQSLNRMHTSNHTSLLEAYTKLPPTQNQPMHALHRTFPSTSHPLTNMAERRPNLCPSAIHEPQPIEPASTTEEDSPSTTEAYLKNAANRSQKLRKPLIL